VFEMISAIELVASEAKEATIQISAAGRWVSVPALALGSRAAYLQGGWVKLAVVHQEDWTPGEIESPEVWLQTLKTRSIGGLVPDVFTFAQQLPNTDAKYSYPAEWRSVAAVRVRSYPEWWEALPQETRKNVRRAQKRGLTVSVRPLDDGLVRGIMGVNNECPIVQGRQARHYGKSLEEVWRDQTDYSERSSFLCAHSGEELVGFMKLVRCGAFASVLTTLTKPSHYDKRPANLLIARAVQLCEDEGIRYLVYGLLNYGNKRVDSLREFKIRNGFEEFRAPRYYVPLTAKGAVYVKLGLYRGLIGILPSQAIGAWLGMRKKWVRLIHPEAGVAQR
jgi:hypothetical protein